MIFSMMVFLAVFEWNCSIIIRLKPQKWLKRPLSVLVPIKTYIDDMADICNYR
jgi:hypothetical protein